MCFKNRIINHLRPVDHRDGEKPTLLERAKTKTSLTAWTGQSGGTVGGQKVTVFLLPRNLVCDPLQN